MQGQTNNRAISKEISGENEKPIPPRFWWLKRVALGFGLLSVLLCVLRFWWGHEAQRRMDALAREAHARGEPFYYPQDFVPAPVPDAENAGVPIEAAARRLQAEGYEIPSQSFEMPEFFGWQSYGALEPSPDELPELQAYIGRYENALRLVRFARGRSKVVFSERASGWPFPPSMYFSPIGQLLVTAANYEHATADDRQAVEYAHDALVLVDDLKRAQSGGIWAPSKLDCETTDLLRRISLEISISNSAGKQTSPQAVRSMIATLLDDGAMRSPAARKSESAGTVIFYSFGWPSALRIDRIADRVFDPMNVLDNARAAQLRSENAEALSEANFQAAKAKWKDFQSIDNQPALGKLAHPLTRYLTTYPAELSFGGYYKVLTERRVVAIMLAIQLYKFDHQNKLPESLADLVPTYLPAVPLDPFDPSNGPIRYLPKRSPPILYSVGFNGKDDGGSKKQVSFLPQVETRWHNEDAVFSLRPQSSFPAQDHQSDEEK